jgi:hypothetical protein
MGAPSAVAVRTTSASRSSEVAEPEMSTCDMVTPARTASATGLRPMTSSASAAMPIFARSFAARSAARAACALGSAFARRALTAAFFAAGW